MMAAMHAAPPAAAAAPAESPAEESADIQILRQLISGIGVLMEHEDDEADKAVEARALQMFQGLLAKEQKERDAALGMTPAHKFVRSQLAQQ